VSRLAFHLDVGHIIPATANTMLFQLLVVVSGRFRV
jgi:hypothetical protein